MQTHSPSGATPAVVVEKIVVEAKPAHADSAQPPGQRSGYGAESVLDLMLKDAAARSPAQDVDTHRD
jgi:hypothetical protein